MSQTPDELRQERIAQRDAALVKRYGPGRVTMSRCQICGWMEWDSSRPDEKNEVQIVEMTHECLKCEEVHRRSPELFMWVVNVARFQEEKRRG